MLLLLLITSHEDDGYPSHATSAGESDRELRGRGGAVPSGEMTQPICDSLLITAALCILLQSRWREVKEFWRVSSERTNKDFAQLQADFSWQLGQVNWCITCPICNNTVCKHISTCVFHVTKSTMHLLTHGGVPLIAAHMFARLRVCMQNVDSMLKVVVFCICSKNAAYSEMHGLCLQQIDLVNKLWFWFTHNVCSHLRCIHSSQNIKQNTMYWQGMHTDGPDCIHEAEAMTSCKVLPLWSGEGCANENPQPNNSLLFGFPFESTDLVSSCAAQILG